MFLPAGPVDSSFSRECDRASSDQDRAQPINNIELNQDPMEPIGEFYVLQDYPKRTRKRRVEI